MVSPSGRSSDQGKQYHILVVKDLVGQRAVILEAATYSLGRDPTNGIQLHSDSVSRQHALMLRVPNSNRQGYRYRIMDGNSDGKRSANGVKVNGVRCESRDLEDGDMIALSSTVSLTYRIVADLAEVGITNQQLESAGYRSIKSAAVERSGTLLMDDTFAGKMPLQHKSIVASSKPTVEDELPDTFFEGVEQQRSQPTTTSSFGLGVQQKLLIGLGAVVVGALIVLVVILI